MQQELDALDLDLDVQILGVNEVGHSSLNDTVCEGRDLPWLQEEKESLIWSPWEITYRDVVIVGPDNERIAAYNLTNNNLGDSAKYDQLKNMLIDAAGTP